MENIIPNATFLRDVFESAGFRTVSSDLVVQEIAADYATYVDKISAGADSVLARLSPIEFQTGIEAMRAHAARVADKPVTEAIDVFVFR
jgi:hypothetical protein